MRVVVVLAVLAVLASSARTEPAPTLRLVTYNVQYDNPDLPRTLDAIAAEDADVVLLQEITARWEKALTKRFAKLYPHRSFRLHRRSPGGMAILSKRPIAAEQLLPPPSGWFFASRLELETPLGRVQVLNVHLRPPIDRGSWVRGYVTTPPIRLREIKAYWPELVSTLPTIIAGDFNEAPDGSAIAFLEGHGLSRAPAAGPKTWRHAALAIDLDHVMLDDNFVVTEAVVRDAGTSDHRPVVVTLARKVR